MIRFLTIAASLLVWAFAPSPASAQSDDGSEEVAAPPTYSPEDFGNDRLDARFVGLSGGIILGAEIVIAAQGLAGVDKLWPYLVFPVLGGAVGGIGGYYLEKTSPGGAVALLVVGIALVVPTAIAAASAFTFNPEKEGVIVEDNVDDTRLSFELPPAEEPPPEQPDTTTEVEAVPEDGEGPPSPEEDEEVDMEDPDESPEEGSAPDTPETEESVPENPDDSAIRTLRRERQRRIASRRSGQGHLIFVADNGVTRVAFPLVDIRPVSLSDNTLTAPRTGVEVLLPLLRVQLP